MNLLECYVTEVLSNPYEKYSKWWVDVNYECWGLDGSTNLMFDSEQEAEKVKKGYKFLS